MQGKRPKKNGANLNYAEEVVELGTHAHAQLYMLKRGPQLVQGVSL